jgi:DNA-binding response OmpR family regulator
MFSAMGDAKDKVEGFELGIEDYITKPFNFSEVLARIRSVLRGRKLIEELQKRKEKMDRVEEMYNSFVSQVGDMRADIDLLQNQIGGKTDQNSTAGQALERIRSRVDSLENTISAVEQQSVAEDYGEEMLRDLDQRMHKHFAAVSDDDSLEQEVRD